MPKMNAISGVPARLHRLFEAEPVRSVCAVMLAALPLIAAGAWLYTAAWERKTIRQAVIVAEARCEAQKAAILARLDMTFVQYFKRARLLAKDSRVGALLRNPTPPRATDLNHYLQEFTRDLDLQRAYILDAQGQCIASDDYAAPDPLVGQSFADREYFMAARRGEPGFQFAVGRVTGVPGFFFAAPIRGGDTILGVAAVKIHLPALAGRIHLGSNFIATNHGVVVLSANPDDLLRAVPGAAALSLPRQERLTRYARDDFALLPVIPADYPGARLYHVRGEAGPPFVMQLVPLPAYGLLGYFLQEVHGVGAIDAQFFIRLYLAVLGSAFVLVVALSLYAYLARDAYFHRNLLELNEKLKAQALYDPLTGCPNRLRFDAVVHQEMRRQDRSGRPLALAMVDLDYFKQVNDSHGHAMGDRMLAHVAGVLRRNMRDTDTLARIGGEEFAVLMPETDESGAVRLMGRLLEFLQASPLAAGELALAQTASVGVAASSGDKDQTQLQHEADIALYVAKKRGRNRVVAASSIDTRVSPRDFDDGGVCRIA